MQAHLGKQAIVRYYFPPEVDYRLSLLPKSCKGLVLWVLEAKVMISPYLTSGHMLETCLKIYDVPNGHKCEDRCDEAMFDGNLFIFWFFWDK